ncbi:MAG: GNAT family N-acetyltransferase [Thiohalomonadales bacterium]
MIAVLLDKNKHNRKRFDCGVKSLNNFLHMMASQQSRKDNIRTFVLEDANTAAHIIGFYSLTMTHIDLNQLPKKLQTKHKTIYAGGVIARLAVDKRYVKQGYGEWLLIDALNKMLTVSETIAFPIVVVDAKDGATTFYEKLGFTPFLDSPNKLFITVADIRSNLE